MRGEGREGGKEGRMEEREGWRDKKTQEG